MLAARFAGGRPGSGVALLVSENVLNNRCEDELRGRDLTVAITTVTVRALAGSSDLRRRGSGPGRATSPSSLDRLDLDRSRCLLRLP